jgi:hypothetical protein
VVEQDFQVFQAGVVVCEDVILARPAIAIGKELVQVANPLRADSSISVFNDAKKTVARTLVSLATLLQSRHVAHANKFAPFEIRSPPFTTAGFLLYHLAIRGGRRAIV